MSPRTLHRTAFFLIATAAAGLAGRAQDPESNLWQLFLASTGDDQKYVLTPYGTIATLVTIEDTHTDPYGNLMSASFRLNRQWTRRTGDTQSTISYQIDGQTIQNRFETDDNGQKCRHTITTHIKGNTDGIFYGDLPTVAASKNSDLARAYLASFDFDSPIHYEVSEEGCNAQAGASGDTTLVLAFQDDGNGPVDGRVGFALALLTPYEFARLPNWSNRGTGFATAAQNYESSGTGFTGGLVESGWNGNETTGFFETPLLDGLTVPFWNTQNPNGSGEDTANWHASLQVNWILFGSPMCGNGEPSGALWKGRFPSSRNVADLSDAFRPGVQSFISALHAAGVGVYVSNTLRDKRDGYLMHHAWAIVMEARIRRPPIWINFRASMFAGSITTRTEHTILTRHSTARRTWLMPGTSPMRRHGRIAITLPATPST